MFARIFRDLLELEPLSNRINYLENWSSISIEGTGILSPSLCQKLAQDFETLNIKGALSFFIGDTKYSNIDEFITDFNAAEIWRLNINKNTILSSSIEPDNRINFFYSKIHFIEWIKQTNPFNPEYFANKEQCKIFVNGLKKSFGGAKIMVCGENCDFPVVDWGKYNEDIINHNIHIIGNSDIVIKPLNHYIAIGELNEESKYFFRNSILILLASLSSDLYDTGRVILRGYRRLLMQLGRNYFGKEITKEYQEYLAIAVKWIYEENERSDLRLKLLLERISLDIDITLPYIQGLFSIIQDATIQAKERYSFITYERKDQYFKELKELLRDIRTLSDLFSTKIRNILGNLLRDVLAALLLIGITQISKISEIKNLYQNNFLEYVFIAFGIYFIVSAILQFIVDSIDIIRSYNELSYWKDITREYMSKNDYKKHIKETLLKRLWLSLPIYIIILLLYIIIGIYCFKIPSYLISFIN
ncbi:hypothetical protein [Porphyromonas pogonae]|uniref:hypothetical protein n=1 Tax=Porphyromonas pogonae TaxID=867595 RepID=UPI002E785B3D|nr:hypothetical protein [Porphyromonas pogonae]